MTVADDTTDATATIHALSGPHHTKIKASFGTAAARVHPCLTRTRGILTFSGDRKKVITLQFPAAHPRHRFCYGQPHRFITRSGHLTKHYNKKNHEWEGVLPRCRVSHSLPCVRSRHWHRRVETIVVVSGAIDPHLSH